MPEQCLFFLDILRGKCQISRGRSTTPLFSALCLLTTQTWLQAASVASRWSQTSAHRGIHFSFQLQIRCVKYSCIFDIEGLRHLLAVFREKQAEEEEGCVSTLVTVSTFVYLIFCNIKVHRLSFKKKRIHRTKEQQSHCTAALCLSLVPFSGWNKLEFQTDYHLHESNEQLHSTFLKG